MDIQDYSSSQKLEISRNSKLYFPAGNYVHLIGCCPIGRTTQGEEDEDGRKWHNDFNTIIKS